jgi:ubiquinone/menaquinone biosynthesis C-methylase UbiE
MPRHLVAPLPHDSADSARRSGAEIFRDVAVRHHLAARDPFDDVQHGNRKRRGLGHSAETRGQAESSTVTDPRMTIAAAFDRSAPTYDRVGVEFFGLFGRRLVAEASVAPGERVLDVGCGRGAVLFAATEVVGPTGHVTGIDFAPKMAAATEAEAKERCLDNVDVQIMDAQEPQLPDASYDVVLASLVVFFLPDPVAALAAWSRALRPAGRLGITTFGGDDQRWSWVAAMQKRYSPDGQDVRPPGLSRFNSDDAIEGMLREAGYVDVRSVVQVHDIVFADADRWLTWTWSQTQRMFWERLDDETTRAARQFAAERLESMAEPDGTILLRQPIRYTTAVSK